MNVKLDQQQEVAASSTDFVKYGLSVVLVVGAFFANYWFESAWPGAIRGLVVTLGIVAALAVSAFTARGAAVREFLVESRFELRKVVWPTRQETTRSTGVILLVVVVISLMLALVDWIISNAVQALLG